jgi:hypothetical protein
MRRSDVEAWAFSVIDRVVAKQPNEDSRVELKSEWPADHYKTARQIAAHANAAHGDLILWLIGVDPKRGVTGADQTELANWWPKVSGYFDEFFPHLQMDLNIPSHDKTVVALLFETDRAPFAVRIPEHGSANGPAASLEVPWRDGTRTRSAKRSDLLRVLVPLQKSPSFEVLKGALSVQKVLAATTKPISLEWRLSLTLYVSPRSESRVVIPFHKCQASLEIAGALPKTSFDRVIMHAPMSIGSSFQLAREVSPASQTITKTQDEILITGPGRLELFSNTRTPLTEGLDKEAIVAASLLPVDADRPVVISAALPHRPDGKADYGPWLMP